MENMDGNSTPESPHPSSKGLIKKLVDRFIPSPQPPYRPTLEDQLKANNMPHGSSIQFRPTTQEQVKNAKLEKLTNSFREMKGTAEALIPPNGWGELEQEAYDIAVAEGKIKEAEAYRKSTLERHQEFLRRNQPKKPLGHKLSSLFGKIRRIR